MSYNQGALGTGAPAPQYTPEEIAYWESMGYVMDPSYLAPAAPAPVPVAYPQYQQPHQPAYAAGASIPNPAGAPYNAAGPRGLNNNSGYYGGGGARSYNGQQSYSNEYEDLNKIFVDPKKAQEEAAAAAAKAEEEEKAAKAKAAATVIRKAAGLTWEDPTLLEFDESKD